MTENFRQFFERTTGVEYPGLRGEPDHVKWDRALYAMADWCDHLRQEAPVTPSLKEREEAPFTRDETARAITLFGYDWLTEFTLKATDTLTAGEIRSQLRARMRR